MRCDDAIVRGCDMTRRDSLDKVIAMIATRVMHDDAPAGRVRRCGRCERRGGDAGDRRVACFDALSGLASLRREARHGDA